MYIVMIPGNVKHSSLVIFCVAVIYSMCYNEQVSIATYVLGMLGSLALTRSGQVPLGMFYAATIQMQLVDYIAFQNPSCTRLNTVATKAGIVINHLEPLVLYGALLAQGVSLPPIVHATVAVYGIVAGLYSANALSSVSCTKVSSTSSPYLYWQWNDMDGSQIVYGLFLLTMVLVSVYGLGELGTVHALLVIISFGVSHIIYGNRRATGALWCWMAAFIPYILLAVNKSV
jgi:hypothetical protein